MKHFRLCNNDLTNWYEHTFEHASDIIYQIKKNGFKTFDIDWKTPVTGEYATLIQVENNKIMFINDNFKLPKAFEKLVKKAENDMMKASEERIE